METTPEQFWRRRAMLTAFRCNLGSGMDVFLPLDFALNVTFCCALLILRRNGNCPPAAWLWYGAGLLLCGLIALLRTRQRFFCVADARVRLERHLGLHNRLTAAAAGVGNFPPIQRAPDGLAFRWERVAAAVAGSAALVLAAAFLPIGPAVNARTPAVQPIAWTQIAGWVEALKRDETVQDAALEELRERMEQLRKQPADDWYNHSSLEAGDSLRDQTAQSIAGLQRDLQTTLGALGASEHFDQSTSPLDKKAVNEALSNALKGLELGTLPLNQELLGPLKEANLSGLKSLTPTQLAALKKRLAAGTKVCAACLCSGTEKKDAEAILLAQVTVPDGKGGGTSPAPLDLNGNRTDLATKITEAISNPDFSRALPGDVTGISKGEHTVDQNQFAGPAAGGAISSTGQGGEAVWRNDLTPAEREVLKRFFQ